MRSFFEQHRVMSLVILGDIIIAIALLITFIVSGSKTATLDILVAPSSATISINGREYKNGTYKFKPGNYTATISKDNFKTKNIDLELTSGHTTKLYTYLLTSDGNLEYYEGNKEDLNILEQTSDETSSNFVKKMSIKKILPYKYAKYNDATHQLVRFVIDVDANDCPDTFCLQAVNYANSSKELMHEILKQEGYNLDDYKVFYY